MESPRKVITRNASPDLNFDRSINPYRGGCEHGCIYCFARPTHAYLGYSAGGLDFETRLIARPIAPDRLRAELLRPPSYDVAPIAIGTNTDPYQPIERRYRVMRGLLEVLSEFRHPVGVVTKGTLIERDLDILGEMGGQAGLAGVGGVSVTTLDNSVSRAMEPRVPAPPLRRLKMIERLAQAGVPVRVMVSPVVPGGLTDHELESILTAARDAGGAVAASYILLRLPGEVGPLFREWLDQAFPDRAARVMGRMRQMRGGGEDYDAAFGTRMVGGQGEFAKLLSHRFDVAARRLGGLKRDLPPLRRDLFQRPPAQRGDQLSLF